MPKTKKKPIRKRAVARTTTATTPPNIGGGSGSGSVSIAASPSGVDAGSVTVPASPSTNVSVMNEGAVTPQKKRPKMSHDLSSALALSPLPMAAVQHQHQQHPELLSPMTGLAAIPADVTTPMAETPMSDALASPTPAPSDRGDMVC